MIDFNDPYVQFILAMAVGAFLGTTAGLSILWFLQWLFDLARRSWKK